METRDLVKIKRCIPIEETRPENCLSQCYKLFYKAVNLASWNNSNHKEPEGNSKF